jgi:V-type H+-transporting ATPase subunit H
MDSEVFPQVCASVNVVAGLAIAAKEAKAERIVRLLVALTKNCMEASQLAGQIVDLQISSSLSSFEYEKWKDSELYNEIREVIGKIEFSTTTHSNISRYETELDSGRLAWSHIHSEKFWQENAKAFETKDFALIKRLVSLLESSADTTTLAVACFDIGEFARLHPLGKKLLARFDAKAHVMTLMSHANREVAREALLCTQKLMLNNWQQISA